jgi:hypothetical protein
MSPKVSAKVDSVGNGTLFLEMPLAFGQEMPRPGRHVWVADRRYGLNQM